MKHLVTALAFAVLGAPASAQKLERRPVTGAAILNAPAPKGPVEAPPAYNGESSKLFATKVHAVLMNACAGCHAREDCAGSYKLKRVDAEYANAEGVERNLLATVKQLDRADPGASPFLAKAVEAHGKAKDAPLRSKAHPAYKYLEVWAHWATMREGSPMPVSIPQAVAKRTEPAAPIRQAAAVVKSEELPKASAVPFPVAKSSVAEPKAADPGDPFDPAAFNRAAHPQRK